MFGLFDRKKKSQNESVQAKVVRPLEDMGASVLLITHNGQLVMVADSLKNKPRDWYGGQVMEVAINVPGTSPYFIYYENETYYFKMAQGLQPLSGAQDFSEYRSIVSQNLCMFLVAHLFKVSGKDIRHPQMSFSHNRIHTNVVAYVNRLNNWYPIQHNSEEPDEATEQKVAQVNSGSLEISQVIAVDGPSPA